MKQRFAHFMVAHSRLILIIFIILALGCAVLIPFVPVNEDMTKYLPKDSAMRHGLDLMEAEFGDEDSSSLEVMFDDLGDDQARGQVLQKLEQIHYVDSVDYKFPAEDEDEEYNKDGYTRFIVNCDYERYSDEASAIWEAVKENFEEGHHIELGGAIHDSNEPGLPVWIVVVAVALIALILLIMASSYIEPVAFLITIGIAVMINMGTYIFFPSISKTTFGIVAILQLVLSMDYSIMLLNRYRQQRKVIPDKNEAMRRALTLSFGAITGSSLTTFAGLLALLFMSFTMGADIGLALAKGVIISLICIFTVLPALLLGFDGLMLRTVKRTPPFDLPRFARFQFRMRIPLTLLFALLFTVAYIGHNGVDFSYSQGKESAIDHVFGHTNTMVMIYDQRDGEAAQALANDLDGDDIVAMEDSSGAGDMSVSEDVSSVSDIPAARSILAAENGSATENISRWQDQIRSAVCYESTLGKQRTAAAMKDFIDDMKDSDFGDDEDSDDDVNALDAGNDDSDTDMDLSENVLRLIYYDYYTDDPTFRMTIPRFVSYLQYDVLNDPDFSDSIDDEVRDNIDDMEKFTDVHALTTRKSAAGLADFFGMSTSQVKQLLLYYQIKEGHASGGKMTLPRFIRFLLDDVASDPDYGKMIDDAAKRKLKSMQVFTNKKKMTKPVTYKTAAKILGMEASQMRLVYIYHYLAKLSNAATEASGQQEKSTSPYADLGNMTIVDLAETLQEMAKDPALKDQFGGDDTAQLIAGLQQIGQMDPVEYDVETMTQVLAGYGIPLDTGTLALIYAYADITADPSCHKVSIQKILHFMLEDKTIRSSLSKKQTRQLRTLCRIIDASVSGKRFSASAMGKILSMKTSDVRSIYLLYQYKYGDTSSWKLTPQQFVNFLVSHVLKDPDMKDRINSEDAKDLKFAAKLINGVVAGTRYTYQELADLLGDYSEDMTSDDLRMLYELFGSEHRYDETWSMDLMQLVTHLDENMVDRPAFASAMEEDEIEDVHEMREDMDEAAQKLEGSHYGRMVITAELEEDSDETRAFMADLDARTGSAFTQDTYLIGNTPMAFEMSRTFHHELNKITLLTALFILIIVLLTFRRLATPVILVLIIQCAVFMTMVLLNALHIDMNYLALLIVQSIMMGATIDYAIIYSSYYVESRAMMPPAEAIRASLRGSLQTILTSAIILIVAAGLLSFAFNEPATRQICRILSVGCLIATLLVIFLLPAILSCLDRFVAGRKGDSDSQ